MKSLESIYNSILLENQNINDIDIKLLKWCVVGTYNINDDGSIDVKGNVNIHKSKYINNLTKIPFKFGKVFGNFWCSSNILTDLENSPNYIEGHFGCDNNELTSLDLFPIYVGGDFYCTYNDDLPYSELFKIVDRVRGDIYYSTENIPEDKDKIRRDRDVKNVLKDDELGDLDV